jgi:hypothetical protein
MVDGSPRESDPEPPPGEPEIADWGVWAVRNAAYHVGALLLAARGLIALIILFKAGVWLLLRDPVALRDAAIAGAGLIAAWGLGVLLAQFAHAQDSPDPTRLRFRSRGK